MISGIVSVACGSTSGRGMPRRSVSSTYAAVNSSATSFAARPSALALVMILSSTSVMLVTSVTSKPRRRSQERSTANTT